MGPDKMCPRVLRKLADVVIKPHLMVMAVNVKSLVTEKKATSHSFLRMIERTTQESTDISFTSVPGKIMG